jgi:hypothetical protein
MEVMNKMGIPHKIIRVVEMTMNHTKAKVKIGNKLSETFEFSTGVKQGDGLSAVLFILALHHAVNKIDQRGTIFTKSSQICANADDIVIVTRSKWRMIQMYEELEKEAEEIGLRINEKKTKYMVVSTSENRRKPQSLKIGNKTFEGVKNFVYLGNIIDNENRINKCVKERIQAGNKAYFANNKLFKNKLISRSTKMQIYRTIVRSVVTYGSETWTLPTAEENALRIFERKILHKIYGPVMENGIWRHRYNDELNDIIKGKDIVRFIKAQRIRWLGHMERMEESAIPKKVLKGNYFMRKEEDDQE